MNDIERRILLMCGENPDAPDVFKDDGDGMQQIRTSIAEAIAEITLVTGGYVREHFLTLRSQVFGYRLKLPRGALGWVTDVWSVNLRRRLEQTDLTRLVDHNPRWMMAQGNPESYMMFSHDIMGFYPKPSGDSDVMQISLVEIPLDYERGTDRLKLKDQFQDALVHYCVSEFWASRGDANEASAHMALYLAVLGVKQTLQPMRGQRGLETQKEPWPHATTS